MTEEQIYAIIPDKLTFDSQKEIHASIGKATEEWLKQNPGKNPDLFNDVYPLMNRMNANAK